MDSVGSQTPKGSLLVVDDDLSVRQAMEAGDEQDRRVKERTAELASANERLAGSNEQLSREFEQRAR